MIEPSRLKVRYKVWLEWDGTVFGEGLFKLLQLVHKTGSISAAAREMSMSYRAAWGKIKKAQERWNVKLVETKVGGDQGGGASLTPSALELINRYYKFQQQVDDAITEIFKDNFIVK
ncbi:molybdate transport system regulatory protein [Desulfohalotomaculum tongense]|uniref:winged helix-turn-helix domain-containing protein n=1 Tax=Desulforadius tongensis TaxID=1216062 RepID=UPI00195637C6|nr:LysR family transcriptional regulator [Desulforadius tongensis]MBM7855338.1 molybdate transport system regulatory protein [Desulforadius tongensis]